MDDPESLSESDSNEEIKFNNLWNIDQKKKNIYGVLILQKIISILLEHVLFAFMKLLKYKRKKMKTLLTLIMQDAVHFLYFFKHRASLIRSLI